MQDIVASMDIDANFQAGRITQILTTLTEIDNSETLKGTKYPLIAMILPVPEQRNGLYYCKIKIPRIVIAQIVSDPDGLQPVFERYGANYPFKQILYPLYYEFLSKIVQHQNVIDSDPNTLVHTKVDSPGTQPISKGLNDFIDSIEILNLELTISQIKKCK